MVAFNKRAASTLSDNCSELGVTNFSQERRIRDASSTSENFTKAALLSNLLNNNEG